MTRLKTNYNHTLGRFTDGADTKPSTTILGVWHEQLAPKMGLAKATPSTSGGKNYAFGGAETIAGQTASGGTSRGTLLTRVTPSALLDNIGKQVDDYTTYLFNNDLLADSNALYVVWGGGNDVINTADAYKKNTKTLDDIAAAGVAAVNNLKGYIKSALRQGGQEIPLAESPADRIDSRIQGRSAGLEGQARRHLRSVQG
jgi:phospholipase/lecithinase/hemolysin